MGAVRIGGRSLILTGTQILAAEEVRMSAVWDEADIERPSICATLYRQPKGSRATGTLSVKTILIIDGAENCAYDHFQANDEFFAILFPQEGQDIEFIEDFQARHPEGSYVEQFELLWKSPVPKKDVRGVDGILFYGMTYKKRYYPNKRDSDLNGSGRAWSA